MVAEGLYDLACACALSADHAARDTALDSARRQEVAERNAGQAVALLQKVRGRGYFLNAANARHMARDEDLNELRGREDFQKLPRAVTGQKAGSTAAPRSFPDRLLVSS
jgi:hypothetical protein